MKRERAQSTLEYVVVLVGIVIAVMAAKGIIQNKVQKSLGDDAGKVIEDSTTRFTQQLNGYGQGGGENAE
ncbi:MAG: hypothetical protein NC914_00065 [Candidatus Omnitrophica bacterium]|nr:hypothetical protein [Candidatus Omnitrophota bacterium]